MSNVRKDFIKVLTTFVLIFGVFGEFGGLQQKAEALSLSQQAKLMVIASNIIAKKYGYTSIDYKKSKFPKGTKILNFKNTKELEAFLKKQNELKVEQGSTATTAAIKKKPKVTTKTTYFKEINGTGSITSYARVNRSDGKVKTVDLWSEQTGVIFALTWDENKTWHTLNKKKTGGTGYVRGNKLYGMSVAGQPVGYSKSVTYKVKF